MPATAPVLLHLTDLHFGWNAADPAATTQRTLSLDSLLRTLAELPSEWRPTLICLSGDIGWTGSAGDYQLAKTWLDELLGCCGLDYSRVLVAAGNHDVVRGEATYFARPATAAEADVALRLPVGRVYQFAFGPFTEFCATSGIPPMRIQETDSHLVGERMLDGVRFVTLNSSWYCRDGDDDHRLWLGLPQIQEMAVQKQLTPIEDIATPITVVLMHHPFEFLQQDEQRTYGKRPNPRNYVATRSHLILTGHTHARMAPPDTVAAGAYHFPGAAAYAGGEHSNGFRLIRLAPAQFAYRAYEYDAGTDSPTWQLTGADQSVPRQQLRPAPPEAALEKKKTLR